MISNLVDRAIAILLKPAETWIEIKTEETSIAKLFQEYLVVLAAIPAFAGFLGALFSGAFFFKALFWGILYYGLSLAGVWTASQIIKFLASNFKIASDEITIFKLVTYSYTAFFVAGIFFLIPPLHWLVIAGFYGFYLFILGFSHLLECPKDDKFTFIILSIVALVFTLALVFAVAGAISGIDVRYLKM